MGWAAIITAILEIVGPVLSDFLKKLLERLLNKAARRLSPAGLEARVSGPEAISELFDEAAHHLGLLAFGRRLLLRVTKDIALRRSVEILSGATPAELTDDERHNLLLCRGAAESELLNAP